MPLRELIAVILSVCGMDPPRIVDILKRGSVVQSASRFRWQGIDAEPADVGEILATFPAADAARPFATGDCTLARLSGIAVPREQASERRLLHRRSFWDELMQIASENVPRYLDYSYRDNGDRYHFDLSHEQVQRLQRAAALLKYSGPAQQIARLDLHSVELIAQR